MKLRPEALEKLNLPIVVTHGLVGELTVKIPWSKLGKEPVIVHVNNVYVLARRLTNEEVQKKSNSNNNDNNNLASYEEEDEKEKKRNVEDEKEREKFERERELKAERLADAERSWLVKRLFNEETVVQSRTAINSSDEKDQTNKKNNDDGGFVQKYAKIILANLQISFSNIHIRYEDDVTTPNHAFAAGLTVRKIAAHTVDESGNPDFLKSPSFAEFRKKLTLDGLSFYFDSSEISKNTTTNITTTTATATTNNNNKFFRDEFKNNDSNNKIKSKNDDDLQKWSDLFMPALLDELGDNDNRILRPISGAFLYTKRSDAKKYDDGETPRQLMECYVDTAGLSLNRAQYHDIARVLEAFKVHQLRSETEHLRPKLFDGQSVQKCPNIWWKYAILAVQIKIRKRKERTSAVSAAVKWQDVVELSRKRRRFLQIYNQPGGGDDDDLINELDEIDSRLPIDVAMTFRFIAHIQRERIRDEDSNSIALAAVRDAQKYYEKEILPTKKGKASSWFRNYFGGGNRENNTDDQKVEVMETTVDDENNNNVGGLFSDDDLSKLVEVFDINKIEAEQKSAESSWKGKDLSISVHVKKVFLAITENDSSEIVSSVALDLKASRNVYKNGNATSLLNVLGWVVDAPGYSRILQSGIDKNIIATKSEDIIGSQLQEALVVSYEEYPSFAVEYYDSSAVITAAPAFLTVEKRFIDSILSFFENTASDEINLEVLGDIAEDLANATNEVAKKTASGFSSALNRMKFEITIDAPKLVLLPTTTTTITSTSNTALVIGKNDKKIVLDLGKFVVSNSPERDQSAANKGLRGDPIYNAFEIKAQNLAAYICSNSFDVKARHDFLLQRASKKKQKHSSIKDDEAYFILAPLTVGLDLLIAGSGWEASSGQAMITASSSPSEQNPGMIAKADIPDLHISLSPCRLAMMYAIMNSFTSGSIPTSASLKKEERLSSNIDVAPTTSNSLSQLARNRKTRIISSLITVDVSQASIALWGQKMGFIDNTIDGVLLGGVERLSEFECAKSEFAIVEIVANNARTVRAATNVDENYVIEASALEINDSLSGGYFVQLSTTSSSEGNNSNNNNNNNNNKGIKLRYDRWTPDSPDFMNCDAQIEIISDDCFLGIRRPTIASVSRFYDELSLVLAANSSISSSQNVTQEEDNINELDDGMLLCEERKEDNVAITFRVAVKCKKLSLTTFVELEDVVKNDNKPAIASIIIHDSDIQILSQKGLNPMKVLGNLGRLSVINETLPAEHPHRYFVDVKEESLDSTDVDKSYFEYCTFDRTHKNFPGHEQLLILDLKRSKVTFLMLFFSKLLGSVGGLLADAIPIDKLPENQREAEIIKRGITRPSTFKYNVSLSHAEITLPKSTSSHEGLKLDAKSVSLGNILQWEYGENHLVPGAVLMNAMSIQLKQFEMFINNSKGVCGSSPALFCAESELTTFNLELISPLWDPIQKMCASEISLSANGAITLELDEIEYNIMLAVLSGNFTETGFIQESLFTFAEIEAPRGEKEVTGDGKVSLLSMISVNLPELRLSMYNSPRLNSRASPLAQINLIRPWVSYETLRNESGAYSVHLTLPVLSVSDVRVGTVADVVDVIDQIDGGDALTLLTMDLVSRADKFDLGINLQSCRLKVDPQFLREVLYFFNLRDDEVRRNLLEERLKNNFVFSKSDLISLTTIEKEEEEEEILRLSPSKRILCDGLDSPSQCTFDANGRKIILPNHDQDLKQMSSLICIGNCRTLTIKNAIIKGDMKRFVSLGTRSSLVYENVTFEDFTGDDEPSMDIMNAHNEENFKQQPKTDVGCITTCSLLARDIELLILDSDSIKNKTVNGTDALSVRLYASLDYKSMPSEILNSHTRTELSAFVNGVTVNLCRSSTASKRVVNLGMHNVMTSTDQDVKTTKFLPKMVFLEPADFDLKFKTDANGHQIRLLTSDVRSSIDSSSLRVASSCISQLINVVEKKLPVSSSVAECNSYVPVCMSRDMNLAFWRPVPQKGFSFLGDVCLCADTDDAPPTSAISVNDAGNVTASPIGFQLVWSSPSKDCFLWSPIPPSAEYVSLGCVATATEDVPAVEITMCKVVRREVAKECEILDCVYDGGENKDKLWRINNSCGTFVVSENKTVAKTRLAAQLRVPLLHEEVIGAHEDVSDDSKESNTTVSDETSIQISFPRISIALFEPGKRDAPFIALGINDAAVVVRGYDEGNTSARDGSASTKIDASFFNPRVASWEPLIEPFDVCARLSRAPLEDSIKISIANAIAVNITSAFGDALVKYQREDQKLVSAGSASDLTILPSSNKMQSNHSMTESNSNESLVSNSNAPLLKNDLRRSIYVRYQHSSKEDIIEVVPGDCITMDEEANSTILSTLDEDREPPDSRISNKIVDGYLRPTLAALSKSKSQVKSLESKSKFVVTFKKCLIREPTVTSTQIDYISSDLYASVIIGNNCIRTRASKLSKDMEGHHRECIWLDKFIILLDADSIKNCVASISIIDARGNGGNGKEISFLHDIALKNFMSDDRENNNIVMPNGCELFVFCESNNNARSQNKASLEAIKGSFVVGNKGHDARSTQSSLASHISRKGSGQGLSSVPAYYISVNKKGPWTKLACEDKGLSETSTAINLHDISDLDAEKSIGESERDLKVVKAVIAHSIEPTTRRVERTIRELSRIRNDTDRAIELFVVPARMTPEKTLAMESRGDTNYDNDSEQLNSLSREEGPSVKVRRIVEEAFENERIMPFRGWSSSHLLPTERRAWSTRNGSNSLSSKKEFLMSIESNKPAEWTWEEDGWEIDASHAYCDDNGFAYAGSFPELKYPFRSGQETHSALNFVRMRRWIRTRRCIVLNSSSTESGSSSFNTRRVSHDDEMHHVTYRTMIEPGCEKSLPSAVIGPEASSHVYFRVLCTDNANNTVASAWAKPVKSGFFNGNFDERVNSESSAIEDAMLKRANKRGGLSLCEGIEESVAHVCENVDNIEGENWFVSVRCERFPFEDAVLPTINRKSSAKEILNAKRAAALSSEWIVTLSAPWCVKNTLPLTAEISLSSYAKRDDDDGKSYRFEKKFMKFLQPGESAQVYNLDPGSKCIARVESINGGWKAKKQIDYTKLYDGKFEYSNVGCPISPESFKDALKKTKDVAMMESLGSFAGGSSFFYGEEGVKKAIDAFEIVKMGTSTSQFAPGSKIIDESSVKIVSTKLDETDVASMRILILCSPIILINRTGEDIVFRTSTVSGATNQNNSATAETSSNPSISDVAMSLVNDRSAEMQIRREKSLTSSSSSSNVSAQGAFLARTLPTSGTDVSKIFKIKAKTERYGDRISFIGAESVGAFEELAVGLISKHIRLEFGCSKKSLSEPLAIADRDFITERNIVVECLAKDGHTTYPISLRSEEQLNLSSNIGNGLEHTGGMFAECLAIIFEPAFSLINNTGETIHVTQVDPNNEQVFNEEKDVIVLRSKHENLLGLSLKWADANLPKMLFVKRACDSEWMTPFDMKSTHTGDILLPINKQDNSSLDDIDDYLHIQVAKKKLTHGASRVFFSFRVGGRLLSDDEVLGSPASKSLALRKKIQNDAEKKLNASVATRKEQVVALRKFSLSIPEFVLSTIDPNVQEIFVVTLRGMDIAYETKVDSSANSVSFVVHSLQIDDMSPSTQYPVLLRVVHDTKDLIVPPMLDFVMRSRLEANGKTNAYEEITINFTKAPVLLAAYEPSLWRVLEFLDHFSDGSVTNTTAATTSLQESQLADPQIFIEMMTISKVRIAISFRASETKRPKRMRKVFPGIVTVVNLDEATLDLRPMRLEKQRAKKSTFQDTLTKAYVKQVKLQAIRLLTGFDALDSVSLALNRASLGLSKLSGGRALEDVYGGAPQASNRSNMLSSMLREKLFMGGRAKHEDDDSNKTTVKTGAAVVGLMDGTETLARGVFSGVTGVFTQPVKGAMKDGAKGFVKGFGKGMIGAVAQPVSGAVGMMSHMAAGASGAVRETKDFVGLSHGAHFAKRIRPARAPSGDGILKPYSKDLSLCEKVWKMLSRPKAKQITRKSFSNEHFAWKVDAVNQSSLKNSSFTLFATNYRLMLLMTMNNAKKMGDRVTKVCWDIAWSDIERSHVVNTTSSEKQVLVCIKLKKPSALERQIKNEAKKAKLEKKLRRSRPEKFLYRDDDLTRSFPLDSKMENRESFQLWLCDQIMLHSRTFGKTFEVSEFSKTPKKSNDEGISESEDDDGLVLFSDSDSDSLSGDDVNSNDWISQDEELDDDDDFDEESEERYAIAEHF
jgi:hypothetical protein